MDALNRRGINAALYDLACPPPDVLILSKRYDTQSIEHARQLQRSGTKIVLDICDNHFYCAQPLTKWESRAEMLRRAVKTADSVVVATQALGEVVRTQCGSDSPVHVIGDAVEPATDPKSLARWRHPLVELALLRLQWRLRRAADRPLRLVWFGNHGSENAEGGMSDILRVGEALRALAEVRPVTLTIISNSERKYRVLARQLPVPNQYLSWHPNSFSRAARLHDIAILPVSINPFTICKSNNRVATALVHGLAVVADPLPSYQDLGEAILLGEWTDKLLAFANSERLRAISVNHGQELIARNWSLPQIVNEWQKLLESVARGGHYGCTR